MTKKKVVIIISASALLLAGAFTFMYFHNRPVVIKPTPVNTTSNFSKLSPVKGSSTTPNPTTSVATNSNTSSKSTTDSAAPTTSFNAPSGSFVSNHKPNLSNSPTPNTEESTCIVQAHISCDISFTKDGVTKSLGAQTAGDNGVVAWQWSLQGLGLDKGSWTIIATATGSNGQKLSTTDPLALEVQD